MTYRLRNGNGTSIVSARAAMARSVPNVVTPIVPTTISSSSILPPMGVPESKGRCIGELPHDVIVPHSFNIPKSWSANDVPLSSVTYEFASDAAVELDTFVKSQCFTSDGLERLLAAGIPTGALPLTRACVPSILAHIDRVGFLIIKAASPDGAVIPPYTHYSSVLISTLLGNLLPQDGEGRKIIGVFQQGNRYVT
jgi:hypothetical protein